jgi:hypothetical protein
MEDFENSFKFGGWEYLIMGMLIGVFFCWMKEKDKSAKKVSLYAE